MERTKFFHQRKGKEGKGTAKDGKDVAKVIRTNTPIIQGKCWNCGKKQVINLRTAGQTLADGHSNRVKDSEILLEREMM